MRGTQTTKHVVIEFSDYQCPFCASHARNVLGEIVKEFVDTGKLRYVIANLPLESLHPLAAKAAQAAECAGLQGKFWEMHDLLFLRQQMLIDTPLSKYAAALNLKVGPFEQCLKSGKTASIVLADTAMAARLGISGTPTFVFGEINGGKIYPLKKVAGAVPVASLKSTIEDLVSGKMKTETDLISSKMKIIEIDSERTSPQ
jgi:protein-disulfide isomerase